MKRLITALLLTASMMASAQTNYDDPTRWAVDAQFGGAIPLIGHNDLTGPGYFTGSTKGCHGTVNKLHAELYMPNTHFSVKGGYERERLSILSGDAETELKEMMLGGRWYPAPWIWNVQPFVGLDGYLNISSLNEHYSISSSEGYQRTTDIHQPRFSVAPVIGMDIFVFSHIAIQMEYGFRGGSWFSHDRHIHLPAHARRDICDQERPASSLLLDRIEGNLSVQVHIRR